MRILIGFTLLLLCWASSVSALQQLHFETARMEEDYEYLIHTVRCAVCVNQPIAESQTTVATDLRREIAERLQAGESRQVIEQALMARYGEAIFYTPPKKLATAALWGGPIILLLIGAVCVRKVIR